MKHIANHDRERGVISGPLVAVITLCVLVVGLGSFSIWAYVAYSEAQVDVDDKIAEAVAQAKLEQADEDDKKFAERAKQPLKKFVAPEDYCSVSFLYPKTWSEYWSEQISSGGDFKAYLSPGYVPPVTNSEQYALRVTIEQKDYDDVLQRYDNLVKSGALKISTTSAGDEEGTRLTGEFSKDIRGDAVIYRCRDYAITLQTDADVFTKDFEALVRTLTYSS
jgi:hypothetical protein